MVQKTFQDVIAYSTGSLSRITFHYPPTFNSHDVVLIFSRWSISDLQSFFFTFHSRMQRSSDPSICVWLFYLILWENFSTSSKYQSIIRLTFSFSNRFLRTKKDRDRYKFKQEEIIKTIIEGKVNDRRESKGSSNELGFLSYGTV